MSTDKVLGPQWTRPKKKKSGPVGYCESGRHLFNGKNVVVNIPGRSGPTQTACPVHAENLGDPLGPIK